MYEAERQEYERQYAEIARSIAGVADRDLKAPNGKPSRLTRDQWIKARTGAFKRWFGDWEAAAIARAHGERQWPKDVSFVVDANGEPLVVYHGTDKAGFTTFDTSRPSRHNKDKNVGAWFAADRRMAETYAKDKADLHLYLDAQYLYDNGYLERVDGGYRLDDGYWYRNDPPTFPTEAEAVEAANRERGYFAEAVEGGIYNVFLNVRDADVYDAKGENWDRVPFGGWRVETPDGETEFFDSEEEAKKYAEENEGEATEDVQSTRDIAADVEASGAGFDGVVFRDVNDEGGYGHGYGVDGDVYVVFHPGQIKSADANVGLFSPENDDILYQAAASDFPPRLYQAIGERGAATMDALEAQANEGGRRLEALRTARAMEEAGKDAKAIRLATGWERGKDEKWRYEVMDALMTVEAYNRLAGNPDKAQGERLALADLLPGDAEIFKAYPQLRETPVAFSRLANGYKGVYDYATKGISLDVSLLGEYMAGQLNGALAHEIQHAIQHLEGFARGGGAEVFKRTGAEQARAMRDWARDKADKTLGLALPFMKAKGFGKDANGQDVAYPVPLAVAALRWLDDPANGLSENERRLFTLDVRRALEWEERSRLAADPEALRSRAKGKMAEANKLIQKIDTDLGIEGKMQGFFAIKDGKHGPDEWFAQLERDRQTHPLYFDWRTLADSASDDFEAARKAGEVDVSRPLARSEYKRAKAIFDAQPEATQSKFRELAEAISDEDDAKAAQAQKRLTDAEAAAWDDYAWAMGTARQYRDDGVWVEPWTAYKRLAGEVEARNAERRLGMAMERRRATLLAETEDVARDEQLALLPGDDALYQAAWHGSPHTFDRFSTDHIDTGEGAQAHGWGLYFAQNREVAEGYRKRLAEEGDNLIVRVNGEEYDLSDAAAAYEDSQQGIALHYLFFNDGDKAAAVETLREMARLQGRSPAWPDWLDDKDKAEAARAFSAAADWLESATVEIVPQGQLYHVEVPDDDVLLDEQRPLGEQPPKVQAAVAALLRDLGAKAHRQLLNEIGAAHGPDAQTAAKEYLAAARSGTPGAAEAPRKALAALPDGEAVVYSLDGIDRFAAALAQGRWPGWQTPPRNGREIYAYLERITDSARAASEALNAHGVKGITYDGHQDGRCYVVFDAAAIKAMDALYQSIGETGAGRLDGIDRLGRLEALRTARAMEEAGKDAKAIRLATGWERGKDEKWRYEVMDAKADVMALMEEGRRKTWALQKEQDTIQRRIWRFQDAYRRERAPRGATPEQKAEKAERRKLFLAEEKALHKQYEALDDQLHPEIWVEAQALLKDATPGAEALKAYPELGDIEVAIINDNKGRRMALGPGVAGKYDHENKKIWLNAVEIGTADEANKVLAHEIQHAIQCLEGFAQGGNSSFFRHGPMFSQKAKDLQADLAHALTGGYAPMPPRELAELLTPNFIGGMEADLNALAKKHGFDTLDAAMRFLLNEDEKRTPFGQYRRLAGEVEARNAAARMEMTPGERRATLLAETEDVARDDQIVILNGADAAEAIDGLRQRAPRVNGWSCISEGEHLIHLTETADKTTFLHETFHVFMRELEAGHKAGTLTPEGQAAWDAIAAHLEPSRKDGPGEKVGDSFFCRSQHELLAREWEAYLMSGQAPAQGLARPFAAIKSWMVGIYRDVRALIGADRVSPDVKGVFDKLAIEAARPGADAKKAHDRLTELAAATGVYADRQEAADAAAGCLALANGLARFRTDVTASAVVAKIAKVESELAAGRGKDALYQAAWHDALYQTNDTKEKEGMKKDYDILIERAYTANYTVSAESREDAEAAAREQFAKGVFDPERDGDRDDSMGIMDERGQWERLDPGEAPGKANDRVRREMELHDYATIAKKLQGIDGQAAFLAGDRFALINKWMIDPSKPSCTITILDPAMSPVQVTKVSCNGVDDAALARRAAELAFAEQGAEHAPRPIEIDVEKLKAAKLAADQETIAQAMNELDGSGHTTLNFRDPEIGVNEYWHVAQDGRGGYDAVCHHGGEVEHCPCANKTQIFDRVFRRAQTANGGMGAAIQAVNSAAFQGMMALRGIAPLGAGKAATTAPDPALVDAAMAKIMPSKAGKTDAKGKDAKQEKTGNRGIAI